MAGRETGRATLSVRRLDADASPVAPTRTLGALDVYLGGLSVTSAHGDVLVSAVVGASPPRAVFVAVLDDGASRGDAIELANTHDYDMGPWVTRVVATPAGALVALEADIRDLASVAGELWA